jgi:ribosomal protein S27E
MGNESNREKDEMYSNFYGEGSYYDELTEDEYGEIISEDESDEGIEVIVICEDCGNRWDDVIVNEADADEIYCPLCGSQKIILI